MGSKLEESLENPESTDSLKRSVSDEESDDLINKKRKKSNHPSVKELIELNETKRSINKSFFRLQSQKLLEKTVVKKKYKEKLSTWIEQFEKLMHSNPVLDKLEDSKFVENLKKQLGNIISCDQQLSIKFEPLKNVGVFGLYKIDAFPGPNIEICLHLTIPKKSLNVKDYSNNRYFIKKYYYLMYIAEVLKLKNLCTSIKCAHYDQNILLPYLVLSPNDIEKTIIKLFIVPEQNYFKSSRCSLETNNVKEQLYVRDFGTIDNLGELPTISYNTALAFDVTLIENNIFIEQLFSNSSNIQEGLKLIVIWMNQRKLNIDLGASYRDFAIYFTAYLLSKGKITKGMTGHQVFKNFLYFILTIDLTKTPLSIGENLTQDELQKYKNTFDIVLMDKTGCYNTAACLHLNAYLKIRLECKLALDILDQNDSNSFSNIFLTKVPMCFQYDAIIDLKSENNYEFLLNNISPHEKAKYIGNYISLVIKVLLEYLNKAFNQRVMNIVPIVADNNEWEYGHPYKRSNKRILFGIKLNPDKAFDILEYGPVLNDPEEKNFKEFWGDLASNRRFRDGTAKIVVYFETNTMKDKRDIIKTIVNYVVAKKLDLKYKLYYNELEDFILNKKVETWYPSGTNEETSMKIIKASDDLGQKIRSLNIKLGISGIGGISDVFCYTNVFPPIPTSYICGKKITALNGHNIVLRDRRLNACPKYVEPIECVFQLAHSSKWPGDLDKLLHMKTAFLIHISDLLQKQFNINSSVKPPYLDVPYEGVVFRYTLYISKEIALLKRQGEPNGLEMEKKLIVVPKIVGALNGINSQYPSYAVSTCLAKRWIRAQLIDEFLLPDMVINLLNAHQYVHKSLFNPAVAPQVAFLRFLKFLAEAQWDWQPIVINFNKELSDDTISKIETGMETNRESYPPLFILTPYDDANSVFTKIVPCKQVLTRLKVLALESLNYIENLILNESSFDWMELFLPNATGFDVVINIKPLLNVRRHEEILRIPDDSKLSFIEPSEEQKYLPVIDFDPLKMYLRDLWATYGEFCVFFHNTYGGNYIGVLWKPGVLEAKEDIVRGFEILGKDIFKSIEIKTQ